MDIVHKNHACMHFCGGKNCVWIFKNTFLRSSKASKGKGIIVENATRKYQFDFSLVKPENI